MLDGRPRQFSGGVSMGKGRQDLRPGPVTSGSVGLAAGGGDGIRPAVLPPGLQGAPKAPRRLLPDSSAGPTIGTRPDTSSTGPGASAAASSAVAVGTKNVFTQAASTSQATVNGIPKKAPQVGPSSLMAGGAGGDKVVVQRDGDKLVMRQLPGATAPGPLSSSTPSMSSHRPAPA